MSSKVVKPAAKPRPKMMPPNAGKGRVKGVPNKVTIEFRQTVQKLLDDNRDNVGKWLTLVAEGKVDEESKKQVLDPDPGRALDLMAKLAEFAAPKLSRAEVTGANGSALIPATLNIVGVKAPKR